MRSIDLHIYTDKDKSSHLTRQNKYSLYLGNGKTILLTDHRQMKDLIVKINDELNLYLSVLNQIYIETFTHYRRRWFILGPSNKNHDLEKSILDSFRDIDRLFDLIITRSTFPNGNHFVFKHFDLIIKEFKKILDTFIQIERKKNNYSEIRCIKVVIDRLDIMKEQLNNLGSETFLNK